VADTESVRVERQGPIATVIIDRPQARNALNSSALRDLQNAFAALAEDSSARVVVLRGSGDAAFSAGADLKELAALDSVDARRRYFAGVASVLEAIRTMPQPVIARVAGFALAGGMGLAVGCDLVIAADNAQFGLPEAELGLFPMVVMAPILRLCGPRAAFALAFSAERIHARRACQLGLVTRVVPIGHLDSEVAELAQKLAGFSPLVMALGKHAIYESASMDYRTALGYLQEMVALVAGSEDFAEGISAFLARRAPHFQGR
jgi:enoyl-CoA hydratase/carnithine racemase